MDGPSADRLRLVLQQSQTVVHQMVNDTFVLVPRREILWEARDGTGDLWQTAAVLYGHGHQHQVLYTFKWIRYIQTELFSFTVDV